MGHALGSPAKDKPDQRSGHREENSADNIKKGLPTPLCGRLSRIFRRGQAANRLGDFLSALPVGNDDGRRIQSVGGPEQLTFQGIGYVVQGVIDILILAGRDEDRGSLEGTFNGAAVRAGDPLEIPFAFRTIHLLSRCESGELFFGRDALVSHIVEDNLDEAERSKVLIPMFSKEYPDFAIEDAYAISTAATTRSRRSNEYGLVIPAGLLPSRKLESDLS